MRVGCGHRYVGNCFVQTMIGEFGLLATISCLNVRQVRTRSARGPSVTTALSVVRLAA